MPSNKALKTLFNIINFMMYIRQEILIGKKNQDLLNKKTISIIGLGALGTNAANLLSRIGVNLILIDYDKVDLTNLQRQSIFTKDDINKSKVEIAQKYLNKVNSDIKIKVYNTKLDRENINLIESDLVLDCTDNLEVRFLINDYCANKKIPWIHAAAIKYSGLIFNIIPGKVCFNCIYKDINSYERCEDVGVLNTITTLVASLQVNEAIKILLNKDYETNLIRINLENNSFDKIKVNKNPNCEVCRGKMTNKKFNLELCRTKTTLSVKTNKKLNLERIKNYFGEIRDAGNTILIDFDGEQVIINKQGEIIFKTLRDENKVMEIADKIYEVGK